MAQTTVNAPLNVEKIDFHKGMLVRCRGFGSAAHTEQNHQELKAKGYTLASGKQSNTVKYFFYDPDCRKCRKQIDEITDLLRQSLT